MLNLPYWLCTTATNLSISIDITATPAAQSVDWSNQNLSNWDSEISRECKRVLKETVRRLSLKGNHFRGAQVFGPNGVIDAFDKMEWLDVSDNKMEWLDCPRLPKGYNASSGAASLPLLMSGNAIERVAFSFGSCTMGINAVEAAFACIRTGTANTNRPFSLAIEHLQIKAIPSRWFAMPHLERLQIKGWTAPSFGSVQMSPTAFEGLQGLRELILEGLVVDTLPASVFQPLQRLTSLSIRKWTYMVQFPTSLLAPLVNLTDLETIFVSNNDVQYHTNKSTSASRTTTKQGVSEFFHGLGGLKRLHVYGGITGLKFPDLPALEDLNWYNSGAREWPMGYFKGVPTLTRIHVHKMSSAPRFFNGTFAGLSSVLELSLHSTSNKGANDYVSLLVAT